ncbi:ankyrin repeat domain-containing protein [Photobacterium phosphoreum]|nr:ankyrin repeat domain-containing protein [Photobacterium phosphoreum]
MTSSLVMALDSHKKDSGKLISLFFDAARIGNNEVLNEFISAGFPMNERNAQSYTALMVTAYYGHESSVELLLNKGANACIEDKRGNTALMGALLKGEIKIARKLYNANCSYGDHRNKSGLSLDEFATLFGQQKVLDSFNK